MLSPVIIIVVFVICYLALAHGTFFDDLFNPGLDKSPQFSGSQLYLLDQGNSVGLDQINGYIGCFGDFNSDKFTDLFVIEGNETDTRVQVFLWDNQNWVFINSSAIVIEPYITNIAAGDFNYDGKLDLMVTSLLNATTTETRIYLYYGDYKTLVKQEWYYKAQGQVSVLDVDNNLRLDLFGEIFSDTSTKAQRGFLLNKGDKDNMFNFSLDPYGQFPLIASYSSAFVDINGDCLADRFVISQDAQGNPQYELLLNAQEKGYINNSVVPMPLGAGQVSFADFDKDGNMDFLIPVCYPRPNCTTVNSIYIYFNKQKPLCSLLSRGPSCRSATALCTADENFHLGVFNATPTDPYFQEVPITLGDHFYFDDSLERPLTLRVGDYNIDGYPDLLIPIVGATGASRIELWENTSPPSNTAGRRYFTKVQSGTEEMMDIPNAYAGAFFDLGDDGVLDMFVLSDNPPRISTIYNNFDYDAFFLKALGLNGVCPEWCPTDPKFPSPKPYGVNYVGGVFKFQYTDLNGKSQLGTGTQLVQSTYMSLHTPYTVFGLGRTSNYIEEFFYGVPLNSSYSTYWTGSTIPNSQVVAVPYKPDSPTSWTLELYITPSGLLFWIMIALILSLIILSIVVFAFYRKEKKEDELKKQEQAHLFSFDAL